MYVVPRFAVVPVVIVIGASPSTIPVASKLVAVAAPNARTPVALALIVALPEVEPLMTTLPPVPPFVPSVMLLVPVIVVNAAVPGVPPPIAPGFGREEVEPPRDTDVPAMVMAEFDRAAFATEEQVGAATALMAVIT